MKLQDRRLNPIPFIGYLLRSIRFSNLMLLACGQILVFYFLIFEGEVYDPGRDQFMAFLLIVLGTGLIASGGYLINDYHDIKTDIVNKPHKVIIGDKISKKISLIIYWSFTFLGLLCGILISPAVFMVNSLSAVLLWYYTIRLKKLPLIGNLTISFLSLVSIALLGLVFPKNQDLVFWYGGITFLVMLLREIIKDVEDIPGDEKEQYQTLPLKYGVRATKKIIIAVGLLCIISLLSFSFYLDEINFWVLFGAISIMILYLLFRLQKADTKSEYKRLSFYSKLVLAFGILSIIPVGL